MTVLTTDVINIKIQGISQEFEAKIDTGATQCSLHVDDLSVRDDKVFFKIGNFMYTAPLVDNQDIASADGGTNSRPVIAVTIEIEGKIIEASINLNDRSEMPQPVLIGQEVIKAAELTLQFSDDENGVTDKGVEQEELLDPSAKKEQPDELIKASSQISEFHRELIELVGQLQDCLSRMEAHISGGTKQEIEADVDAIEDNSQCNKDSIDDDEGKSVNDFSYLWGKK